MLVLLGYYMSTSSHFHNGKNNNVVDLFSGKPIVPEKKNQVIRISPEYDGLAMLYSNNRSSPNKLYTMNILCWALCSDGDVVAMVPWLNKVVPCTALEDPCDGRWEGYYDKNSGEIFYEPPIHKILEMETAVNYYGYDDCSPEDILQEIPDTIGTHAMLNSSKEDCLLLTEVLSWRLTGSGDIQAMLVDPGKVENTPVLPGDSSLYPASQNNEFRYFFQHHIANQIKSADPEAIAAISQLLELH